MRETPIAAPKEEGYSFPETVRAETSEVLYFPALALKMKNSARQRRHPHVRDKATQTEAEATQLRNPSRLDRLIRLLLFLAATSLALAWISAIPGAHAQQLTTANSSPSSAIGLLHTMLTLSLIVVTSQILVTHVAATALVCFCFLQPEEIGIRCSDQRGGLRMGQGHGRCVRQCGLHQRSCHR